MRENSPCKQLKEAVENGAQLVDVRSPAEHALGCIDGSINVPVEHIHAQAKYLDPAKPILLYCVSGARAQMAQQLFNSLGFNNVFNVGRYNSFQHC